MNHNFINVNKLNIYYFLLVIMASIFPLTYYPRIYGTDAFQVIWMTNAFRNGALFSDNTWLISPFSYFGYYTFSHRAIGVPMILAFLMSLLEFLSFGRFGIPEAILTLDIILIIIIYKSSQHLGNRLFEEQWSRFIFTAAILLSPNIISETTMYVPTRVILTIVMILLLNMNIKLLDKENNNKLKATIIIFLLLLIGALAHRLWVASILTIIFMIFTVVIQKYKKLQKLMVFLILPISAIAFFVGLEFFNVDPIKIWSPFFDNSTLIGLSTNLSIHYMLQIGLILIFFPVGVIITLYKLAIFRKLPEEKMEQPKNNNFYLILFIIPFSFMVPTFYSTAIFLPIIIYFSVQGLVHIKRLVSKFSSKINWFFPLVLLLPSIGYSLLYVEIYININLWYIFLLISISLLFYLLVFLSRIYFNFNSFKIQKCLNVFLIIVSILIFTTTTVVGKYTAVDSNPYPWDNRYLTDEEIDIIDYFQSEYVDGLIFCAVGSFISERIAGFGFLPSFFDRTSDGKALYYGFTTPYEVNKYTYFSLSEISELTFFSRSFEWYPIRILRNSIINLNVSLKGDIETLRLYNVRYIITEKETVFSTGANWVLIQSLSTAFIPVFSTPNLLVWRLY